MARMPSSKVTHDGPTTGLVLYWLGRAWLQLFGWQVVGEVPQGGRFVVIGAPHTSNWDFFFTLATAYVYRLRISWMGKHTAFRKPFGWLFRGLGGIPINRTAEHGVVEQIALQFGKTKQLVVAVAPSGTRSRRAYWKSGFYWIAHTAQVPILCAFMDYKTKRVGLGLSFMPSGDPSKDMDRIREFYKEFVGKKPELVTPIRLKDEGEDAGTQLPPG